VVQGSNKVGVLKCCPQETTWSQVLRTALELVDMTVTWRCWMTPAYWRVNGPTVRPTGTFCTMWNRSAMVIFWQGNPSRREQETAQDKDMQIVRNREERTGDREPDPTGCEEPEHPSIREYCL